MSVAFRQWKRRLIWLWALPLSLPGLLLWLVFRRLDGVRSCGRLAGAGIPVLYAHGRWAQRFLQLWRWPRVQAMALGCIVLAVDEASFERCLAHELVHVRQGLRWGIFFVPLYMAASLWAGLRGRDMYRDNVFEREAYALEDLPPQAILKGDWLKA